MHVVQLNSQLAYTASSTQTDSQRSFFPPSSTASPNHNMNGTTEPTANTAISASTQTTSTEPPKMNGSAAPEAGLFGDNLVSPDVAAALPSGYKIRALRQSDYHAGFLDCLRVLTTVGDISEEKFTEQFEWIKKQDGSYYVLVIEDGGRVVGTGALIAERKLYDIHLRKGKGYPGLRRAIAMIDST